MKKLWGNCPWKYLQNDNNILLSKEKPENPFKTPKNPTVI